MGKHFTMLNLNRGHMGIFCITFQQFEIFQNKEFSPPLQSPISGSFSIPRSGVKKFNNITSLPYHPSVQSVSDPVSYKGAL